MSTKVTLAYNETNPVMCDKGCFHREEAEYHLYLDVLDKDVVFLEIVYQDNVQRTLAIPLHIAKAIAPEFAKIAAGDYDDAT